MHDLIASAGAFYQIALETRCLAKQPVYTISEVVVFMDTGPARFRFV
jgi:hypothetical protein